MASLLFVFTLFAWAYGQIITKTLKSVNSIQINIHLGVMLFWTSALCYPTYVTNPVPL